MVKVINEYKRPSVDVEFYSQACAKMRSNICHHRFVYYNDNILSITKKTSEDELTVAFETVWDNLASYERYVADPFVQEYARQRDEYNAEAGIITSPVVVSAQE